MTSASKDVLRLPFFLSVRDDFLTHFYLCATPFKIRLHTALHVRYASRVPF